MALRARQVPIFVSGGIDTKTDPRVMPQGSLIEIENMYYQRTGELRLRNGFSALVPSGTTGGLDNLYVSPNGLLYAISTNWSFGGGREAIKNSGSPLFRWGPISISIFARYPWCSVALIGIEASETSVAAQQSIDLVDCDFATAAGVELYTWRANVAGSVTGRFRCITTGGLTLSNGFKQGGVTVNRPPMVCAAGTTALCMFSIDNSGTPSLIVDIFATNSGAPSTLTVVLNGVSAAQPWFDVKPRPGATSVIVAYRSSAGGVSVLEMNSAGSVITGPVNIAAADATMTLGFLDDQLSTGNYYLATAGATSGVVVRTLNAALAVTATNTIDATATANVRNITGHLTTAAPNYTVLWDVDAVPSYNTILRRGIWTGSAAVSDFGKSFGLYSRSFKDPDGNYHVIGSYDSTVQPSYSVIDTDGTSQGLLFSKAQILPGTAGGRRSSANSISSFAISGASALGALCRKQRITTAAGNILSQRSVSKSIVTFSSILRRPRELGGTMFWPGGIVMRDDGDVISWATCPFALEAPTAVSAAGGSMTPSGAYSYKVILKRIDAAGRITRSPESIPAAITLGAGDSQVTLTIQNPQLQPLSYFKENYIIEAYRSGPAAAGATGYNKIGEIFAQAGGTFTLSSLVDQMSDANANLGETLYTTGGTLENFVTPSCTLMEVNAGRLWIVNAEYPTELWYSKEYKQGFGIGFHPLQTLRLEGDGYGAITALAAMDGRLIAFKSNAIYVISGDGPNDLGQGSFNPPQAVSLNVGTVLPGSVVATPDGIMFQAAAGMFLLTRGLSVTYVGKPVEQYTLAANVVDASRVSGTTQIRFVMANGRCLVWDYGVVGAPQPGVQAPPGMWTTFLLAVGGSTVVACADAPGGWCYALANGTVNQETPGVFTDPGNLAIVPRVGFPHLALANIAGFQRVQGIEILGEFVGNHTLAAQFEYDYSGGVTETRTKAITAGAYLYGVLTAKQKCTALKLTLTTSAQAAGSGAFRLTGVNLLVAGKAGQFTLPPASFLT